MRCCLFLFKYKKKEYILFYLICRDNVVISFNIFLIEPPSWWYVGKFGILTNGSDNEIGHVQDRELPTRCCIPPVRDNLPPCESSGNAKPAALWSIKRFRHQTCNQNCSNYVSLGISMMASLGIELLPLISFLRFLNQNDIPFDTLRSYVPLGLERVISAGRPVVKSRRRRRASPGGTVTSATGTNTDTGDSPAPGPPAPAAPWGSGYRPAQRGYRVGPWPALPASFESWGCPWHGESNAGFLHTRRGAARTAAALGVHFHPWQEALPEGAFS
ncbi:uncharacterized protein LOC134159753 [Pezoporus occidentalis]|uniref:uncharacterized protein LOC134159753 n=1 Tax=Pezoporus occidentalis TaxID=407982 RepID=UPI002F9149EC